ncbi:Uncharacterised protein [Fusobacterium periodonticum]|nr:Uncharacterised protein [Fusobacterium periodonticum]
MYNYNIHTHICKYFFTKNVKLYFLQNIKIDFCIYSCYNLNMKIKDILKEYNVKLMELSKALSISRPTLNSYIDEFEKEGKISNKEYYSFFKKISEKKYRSREELLDDIESLKKVLINKKFSDLLPENLKLLQSIYNKIYEDMKGKDEVIAIYKFINSAINNYGEDKTLSGYINYTLYLNGLKEIKEITVEDKILVSNIFPIMKKYEKSQLKLNDEGLKEFYNRVEEIKKNREERYKKFEKILKEKVMKEFNTKEKLNKEDLKRILNNLDLKKI